MGQKLEHNEIDKAERADSTAQEQLEKLKSVIEGIIKEENIDLKPTPDALKQTLQCPIARRSCISKQPPKASAVAAKHNVVITNNGRVSVQEAYNPFYLDGV